MVKTDVELQSNDVIDAYNKIVCEKNQLIVKNEKKKLAEKRVLDNLLIIYLKKACIGYILE